MIVVTAPTAKIGRHVVNRLLASGTAIRVIARDPGRLSPEVLDRVEVVEGSHGDHGTINRALEGATSLFWLAPSDPTKTLEAAYLDFTKPAVDAIRRNDVKRVVSITALGRGTRWEDNAGLVTASIRMDDLLMTSGAAFRGLAMPSFMDNVLRQAASIGEKGVYAAPYEADAKYPTTATRDMGAVAARLLDEANWADQLEHPVLGPEDLSPNEMAEIMSESLGRSVRYETISFATLRQQMLDFGASESFAQGYVDMFRAKVEGMDNVAERTTESRTPTSFRDFCMTTLRLAVHGQAA